MRNLSTLKPNNYKEGQYSSVRLVSLVVIIILQTLGFSLLGSEAEDPSSFKELDRWYEVFLSGSKVGHAHCTMKLEGEDVVSQSIFNMKMNRAGISITMSALEKTRETRAGKIKSFSGEIKMAGVPIIKKGWIEGQEIIVKEKQFLRETEKRYPLDPEGRMTWGLMKLLQENGFQEKGHELETKIYSADFGMASPTKAKIKSLGQKIIKIGGEDVNSYKSEITLFTKMGKMKTINWLDEDGFAIRTKMQMGGIPIEIKQSTELEAQSRSDKTNFDFLFQTLLFLDEEIPDGAQAVRFNVKLNNGQVTPIFHQTRNQKITPLDEKSFIVDVRSELWGQKVNSGQKIKAIGREYREANIMIDSEDPLIRNLAKNAAQGSKNMLDLSQNLYRFAQKYIHHKNFNVGFASATETAKSREGDCTEHAVFLAALGRVHGIPTRVANGLVFMESFGNQKNVMGFHMWTEFHLNGKWHSLDSAMGKMGAHADRITLSVSSLEQDSLLDIGIKLSEIIGNINVQVEKVSLRK